MPLDVRQHYILIGKGGEVIKALEAESSTAICFTQTPEPAMVVLGEEANRRAAMDMAKARLDNAAQANDQEVFQVPKRFHADLIGARGRNIQRIEEETGALIHFSGDNSDDCCITGTADQRLAAWQSIQNSINSAQVRLRVCAPAREGVP